MNQKGHVSYISTGNLLNKKYLDLITHIFQFNTFGQNYLYKGKMGHIKKK